MRNDFYWLLVEQSSTGYANHRIICDGNGIPCDYEFVEVNAAFEKYTGLKRADIIGKRATEILPKTKAFEFDWVKFYGEIALSGGEKEFEQYCKQLNKWYKVEVYSPERNCVITHLSDIDDNQIQNSEAVRKEVKEEYHNVYSLNNRKDLGTRQHSRIIKGKAALNAEVNPDVNADVNAKPRIVGFFMNTLYEKNKREMFHSKRVGDLCEAIASEMYFDVHEVYKIRIAGLMHDIGKIEIDERILNKSQKLDEKEWEEIKKHPEIGARILNSVKECSDIAGYVLEHHEFWDGKGYPRGLKGEEISIQARIIAVADAFDAMTSNRTYGKPFSTNEAIEEIKRCSETQFDPEIVSLFVEKVLSERKFYKCK